ncbi:MAG TPA: ABC transporter ATP-binding protein/permease [Geminicoccaceae bacterium]|nr:ABC transporter ATP-binding protein/permease [Geminicoccaceae bacterium]
MTDPAGPPGLRSALVRLLPHLWPEDARELRVRVVLAFVFLLLAKLINVAVPFFYKAVVDQLTPGEAGLIALPLAALLAYGGARFGAALFEEARDAIFAKVAERAGRKVSLSVFQHLFTMSLRYHLERRTGELARAIDRGVKAVSFMLGTILFSVVPILLEFALVIGILLARYEWPFALIVFVTISIYAVFTIVATEWRTKFRRIMNEHDNAVSAQAVDSLLNYETVKTFTNEGYEGERFDRTLAAYERAAAKSDVTLAVLNFGQGAIIAVGITIIMIVAAQGVVAGRLTIGDLVLVNAFLLQLYQPLNALGFVYRQLKQSIADLEHLAGLLALRPEVADRPGAPDLALAGGAVRFAGVGFGYDARRPVLHDLSFAIPAGHTLAVVGSSGAGKSTLVRLLFRFYDVDEGAITIDGQDLRDVTQASLRAAIGLVPQDTVLFNDTIGANIAYGRPGAPQAAIEAAARAAQIHDFVATLPAGYDTMVGERGLKLSGGEKQRVAIARMVLKDPPILVFDEATSALDSRTERMIQAALRRLSSGRTTLIIAHRLSTVVEADQILVLEHGRVVEQGRHRQLVAQGGAYAQMWARQQAMPAA